MRPMLHSATYNEHATENIYRKRLPPNLLPRRPSNGQPTKPQTSLRPTRFGAFVHFASGAREARGQPPAFNDSQSCPNTVMPRLPRSVTRHARAIDKNLLPLVRTTRDLQAAKNELRWLTDHAAQCYPDRGQTRYRRPDASTDAAFLTRHRTSSPRLNSRPRFPAQSLRPGNAAHLARAEGLQRLIRRRARGEPLQYILGSAFFGDLEIQCRPGVLIPRWETAAAVEYLVQRLCDDSSSIARGDNVDSRDAQSPAFRLLDLCTGSGCIPLLFGHEFTKQITNGRRLECVGVDFSQQAIDLARENAKIHTRHGVQQTFLQADLLAPERSNGTGLASLEEALSTSGLRDTEFDVLISNPPYISPATFSQSTERSVRRYEPRLALVPPGNDKGMTFYPVIMAVADRVRASVLLLEVADLEQAVDVVKILQDTPAEPWSRIEIWRDEPMATADASEAQELRIGYASVSVRGSGHGRSVVAWRGKGLPSLGSK